MPVFKELDPAITLKLLEGYEDELTGEATKLEAFYRQFSCPTGCKEPLQKELERRHAFADADTLVPRALLRCTKCQLLLNPFNGMIIEAGKRIEL